MSPVYQYGAPARDWECPDCGSNRHRPIPCGDAPDLSPRERSVVKKFETAPVLPESWEARRRFHVETLVALDHVDAEVPNRSMAGDAGADLYTSEQTTIRPGTFADVPCGIRLQLPPGYWARITGRSSTLRKRGLLVSEAVIDNGYTGPIYAGVWNLTRDPVIVRVGERIAQLILNPIVQADYRVTAGELVSIDGRGSSGFGSSGR